LCLEVIKKDFVFDMNTTHKKKRAAIYARVSTDDMRQDPETQLMQLREYARVREIEVLEEFVDYATGTTEDRSHYRRLFEAVLKGRMSTVLVCRYDRDARSTQAAHQFPQGISGP